LRKSRRAPVARLRLGPREGRERARARRRVAAEERLLAVRGIKLHRAVGQGVR